MKILKVKRDWILSFLLTDILIQLIAPQMLTRPTAASSSTSWRDGTSSSEDKAAENEGGSIPSVQDTGYERFIDRSCE